MSNDSRNEGCVPSVDLHMEVNSKEERSMSNPNQDNQNQQQQGGQQDQGGQQGGQNKPGPRWPAAGRAEQARPARRSAALI